MTLLISWVGIDPRGVASIYIASDSRVTWGNSATFDFGRKVFAFSNYPDILGYCGDVLFPSIVLGQIVEMADSGLLFNEDYNCKQKFEAIKEKLIQIFHKYPNEEASITDNSLQVVHASRDPNDCRKFFFHTIESGVEIEKKVKDGKVKKLNFLKNRQLFSKAVQVQKSSKKTLCVMKKVPISQLAVMFFIVSGIHYLI